MPWLWFKYSCTDYKIDVLLTTLTLFNCHLKANQLSQLRTTLCLCNGAGKAKCFFIFASATCTNTDHCAQLTQTKWQCLSFTKVNFPSTVEIRVPGRFWNQYDFDSSPCGETVESSHFLTDDAVTRTWDEVSRLMGYYPDDKRLQTVNWGLTGGYTNRYC